jgi:hypothetical protein
MADVLRLPNTDTTEANVARRQSGCRGACRACACSQFNAATGGKGQKEMPPSGIEPGTFGLSTAIFDMNPMQSPIMQRKVRSPGRGSAIGSGQRVWGSGGRRCVTSVGDGSWELGVGGAASLASPVAGRSAAAAADAAHAGQSSGHGGAASAGAPVAPFSARRPGWEA